MTKPVRLQLSRKKGFDLQALSRSTNGLAAMNVARPSRWGNPVAIGDYVKIGDPVGRAGPFSMAWCKTSAAYADETYTWIGDRKTAAAMYEKISKVISHGNIDELRGKNLACWCPLSGPCHADVLLELANRPPAQPQASTEP